MSLPLVAPTASPLAALGGPPTAGAGRTAPASNRGSDSKAAGPGFADALAAAGAAPDDSEACGDEVAAAESQKDGDGAGADETTDSDGDTPATSVPMPLPWADLIGRIAPSATASAAAETDPMRIDERGIARLRPDADAVAADEGEVAVATDDAPPASDATAAAALEDAGRRSPGLGLQPGRAETAGADALGTDDASQGVATTMAATLMEAGGRGPSRAVRQRAAEAPESGDRIDAARSRPGRDTDSQSGEAAMSTPTRAPKVPAAVRTTVSAPPATPDTVPGQGAGGERGETTPAVTGPRADRRGAEGLLSSDARSAAPAPMASPAASFSATLAGAQAASTAPPSAMPESRIDAPLDSPGFLPSLGAQVSTLVRNGVPEARLHLHPAELGPITVQIAVDGQRAQVHMAVEHAVTRQLLEQGIPMLATALRDSGLTLAGGGVFQQPRDPQPQSQGDSRSGSGGRRERSDLELESLAPVTAAGPRERRQLGALDLYA